MSRPERVRHYLQHERLKQRVTVEPPVLFTLPELRWAVKQLATGKAVGPDALHAEFFLQAPDAFLSLWLTVFNRAVIEHKVASLWKLAHLVAIAKPGKPADRVGSFRPIAL
eukprot:288842-Amphidinium_carterae.1